MILTSYILNHIKVYIMVACKNCGCELKEGAKFCPECGTEVIVEKFSSENQFCPNCGYKMPKGLKFCPVCGSPTSNAPQVNNTVNNTGNFVVNKEKDPTLAAILSFLIVGLGQIYLGLTKKGILLFIGAIISGFLMLILIGFVTWLLIWGYAIYDAHNSAKKMNNGIAVEDTIDINNLF